MDVSTTPWIHTLFSALVGNLFHSFVGLLWIAGFRRLARPVPPDLTANLLTFVLIFPALITASQILGIPGPRPEWVLVRIDAWAIGLSHVRTVFFILFLFFLAAISLIFFAQEFVPFWKWRRGRHAQKRERNARVDRALSKVRSLYEQIKLPYLRGRELHAYVIEADAPVAALHGLFCPELLISRSLLDRLNDDELEAVVAHELAHHRYGGNAVMFLIWIFRALQAPNPAAFIAFRDLVETRELACDQLAAWLTRKPVALAKAIVRVDENTFQDALDRLAVNSASASSDLLASARDHVVKTAESAATKARVQALLSTKLMRPAPVVLSWLGAIMLGALMWVIR